MATGYCTVQDLRDQGVPSSGVGAKTDAELQVLIARASRMVDFYTGRFFEPRSLVLRLDGTGRRGLLLGHPIVSVSGIRLVAQDFLTASDIEVDLADVRVYNRHLSGLLAPDDRENPRIEFLEFDHRFETLPLAGRDTHGVFTPQRWPEGTQNVEVTGIFGYTDPDGSPTGQTPDLIARATCLIVLRRLLASELGGDAFDNQNAWRLTELRTRDQTIKWADPSRLGSRGIGAFTGDPEIDSILAGFVRSPELGAA